MRRLFPLSTAAGLTLSIGCAPGKAEIEILDEDGDGYDDDFGWGDGNGDGDGDDDTPPDTPGDDPDEPDDPGDDPDDPGDEPDEVGALSGAWSLLSWSPYDLEYTYRGEQCTYVQNFGLVWEFDEAEDGAHRGVMFLDYAVDVYGEDCPYDGTYTGTERYDVQAESVGGRTYEIRVREWDLRTDCTVDGDDMRCDVGMEWEREG